MKFKRTIAFILFMFLFIFAGCSSTGEIKTSKTYAVNTSGFENEIEVSDFDLSNLKIEISVNKNGEIEVYAIDVTSNMLSQEDLDKLNTAGDKTITVNYNDWHQDVLIHLVPNASDVVKDALDKAELVFAEGDNKNSVTQDITLPTNEDVVFEWSSNSSTISNTGVVTRSTVDTNVKLTLKATYKNFTLEKAFDLVVIGKADPNDVLEDAVNHVGFKFGSGDSSNYVTQDITLPTNSTVNFEWSSNNPAISNTGVVTRADNDINVQLTLKATYQDLELQETYDFVVKGTQTPAGNTYTGPNNYYKNAVGKEGNDLKLALRTIISVTKHTESYEDLKKDLQKADASPTNSNKILLFYLRTECNSAWDGGNTWNREHIWPQSKGWFTTSGAGADLHHLRAADPDENSRRGNKPYGTASGYYEPKDEVKGDVARILFYLLVRYQESDRYQITVVAQSMKMLLDWNELDPVDSIEQHRNEVAYSIQGNRNPFIDYSDYAYYIWDKSRLD